eukprot:scaffold2626_cov11-Prasinocladus_malaysianus.AAC.1
MLKAMSMKPRRKKMTDHQPEVTTLSLTRMYHQAVILILWVNHRFAAEKAVRGRPLTGTTN